MSTLIAQQPGLQWAPQPVSPCAEKLMVTAGAGACILAGALLARLERLHSDGLVQALRHVVIVFGGGLLLAT